MSSSATKSTVTSGRSSKSDTVIRANIIGTLVGWNIVTLDEQQLIFGEGGDLFTLTKRGDCN